MSARVVLGTVLVLHGLTHPLGSMVYWKLAEIGSLSNGTRLLSDTLEVGEVGARVFGLLWLLAAEGFIVAGLAVFSLRSWWPALTLWVTLLSLVVTVLGLPDSWFGIVLNVGILAYLLVGGKRGWLPQPGSSTYGPEEARNNGRGWSENGKGSYLVRDHRRPDGQYLRVHRGGSKRPRL